MTSFDQITNPDHLWSRSEVLNLRSPVPREPGLYVWYFKEIPPGVPTAGCIASKGLTLLYSGISPKASSKDGQTRSSQTLRDRIRDHFKGSAEGSTLRLTLGTLLAETLKIELRRVGSGNRMTFASGEQTLSNWMDDNALVAWVCHAQPWELESQLITSLSLPLNLNQNKAHVFHAILAEARRKAKQNAREKPVIRG